MGAVIRLVLEDKMVCAEILNLVPEGFPSGVESDRVDRRKAINAGQG